jgi:hypothetical protein
MPARCADSDLPRRQADSLKEEVDRLVIKEGLIGVGMGVSVLAGIVGLAIGIAKSSKR